jgi:hypothetical protein
MAISLIITESDLEKIAGIPSFLTVETNVPASIFYTLDGSAPDINSNIYIDQINLPSNFSKVTVKIFATNGIENSAIFSQTYGSSFVGLDPGSSIVTNYNQYRTGTNYSPFGDMLQDISPTFGPAAGLIIDDSAIPNILDGYDAAGNAVGSIDQTATRLDFIYSETDGKGNVGRGIGTVSYSTIRLPDPIPDQTSVNDKFFNPKAKVIFQSFSDTANQDISMINRGSFTLINPEIANNGAQYYYNPGTLQSTGSALRQHFNPKDSTITYYYFDSSSLRWIISKEKFLPTVSTNYSNVIPVSRTSGVGLVFKWYPFFRSRII